MVFQKQNKWYLPWIKSQTFRWNANVEFSEFFKDFRHSDKFYKPYRLTNDNSEHLCAFVCTCVRYLLPGAWYPALPARTFFVYNILLFLWSEFYNNFTKLAVSIDLQHSYCNIVFFIMQFKVCLYNFCTTLKGFIFNNCF